jgi:hypothetical protein
MIGLWIVSTLVVAVATLFAWIAIHEYSHLIGLKLQPVKILRYAIFPYPHKYKDKFYWGRFHRMTDRPLELHEQRVVSFAPRIPDLAGMLILWVFLLLTPVALWSVLIVVFLGGAVVDMITGSIGVSPNSDLRRYAGSKTWIFRIAQSLLAGLSIAFVVLWALQ